jgi:hypothetical protein
MIARLVKHLNTDDRLLVEDAQTVDLDTAAVVYLDGTVTVEATVLDRATQAEVDGSGRLFSSDLTHSHDWCRMMPIYA